MMTNNTLKASIEKNMKDTIRSSIYTAVAEAYTKHMGKKIEQIKYVRGELGSNLKDSKDLVETHIAYINGGYTIVEEHKLESFVSFLVVKLFNDYTTTEEPFVASPPVMMDEYTVSIPKPYSDGYVHYTACTIDEAERVKSMLNNELDYYNVKIMKVIS